jgi:hypothetical protein
MVEENPRKNVASRSVDFQRAARHYIPEDVNIHLLGALFSNIYNLTLFCQHKRPSFIPEKFGYFCYYKDRVIPELFNNAFSVRFT